MDPFVEALKWVEKFQKDQIFWDWIRKEFPKWTAGDETL